MFLYVYRVPIYKAESLDTQLDEVWNILIKESIWTILNVYVLQTTVLMLRDYVELDSVKKTAVVPKVQ